VEALIEAVRTAGERVQEQEKDALQDSEDS